jgi:hypothetical protein
VTMLQQSYAVPCSYIERLCPGGATMHRQGSRCFVRKRSLSEAGVCAKGKARCGIPQRARRTIGTYVSQAWSVRSEMASPAMNRTGFNEPFILHSHVPYIYTLPWTWGPEAETSVC